MGKLSAEEISRIRNEYARKNRAATQLEKVVKRLRQKANEAFIECYRRDMPEGVQEMEAFRLFLEATNEEKAREIVESNQALKNAKIVSQIPILGERAARGAFDSAINAELDDAIKKAGALVEKCIELRSNYLSCLALLNEQYEERDRLNQRLIKDNQARMEE